MKKDKMICIRLTNMQKENICKIKFIDKRINDNKNKPGYSYEQLGFLIMKGIRLPKMSSYVTLTYLLHISNHISIVD